MITLFTEPSYQNSLRGLFPLLLAEGTLLRFVQGILDPLQQTVADGCHLTRNTAASIARAGFADLDVNEAVLSTTSFLNPQIYGIAYR